MTTGSDNLIFGPLANARTLLASCPAFQALVGVEHDDIGAAPGLAAALAHVYCPAVPEPLSAIRQARPFALLDQGEQRDLVRTASTGYQDSGSLLMFIEADVPDDYLPEEGEVDTAATLAAAHQWFCELLGDVFEELLALGDGNGRLLVRGVHLRAGPMRSDATIRASEGDFYQAAWSIDWGVA